jgi:hypothetical protein
MSFNMRLLKLPLSDALERGKAGDREVRWLGCAPLVLFSHKQTVEAMGMS